ncbi:MAG TPA: hypothetical protein VNK49_02950 [Anaerolineales bacterium]|nr:hypothetical protein [Anaerolineales bacterium]
MTRLKMIFVVLVGMLISACGAQATPTINPVDVQNTAVAAAFTMVAETQAAIPTNTPIPPTETPSPTPPPTETPIALPTLAATLTPTTAASSSGGDPCATRVLSWSPKGKPTTIEIVNSTRATVIVSLYLNETPDHFECGYRSYTLGSRGSVTISDLVYGCYNIWAFTNDPKQNPQVNASGYGCINNPDKWTFEISQSSIKFIGP